MAQRSRDEGLEEVTFVHHDYRVKAKLRTGVAKSFDDGDAAAARIVYHAFVDAAVADGYTHFPVHYHPGIFKRYPVQVVW